MTPSHDGREEKLKKKKKRWKRTGGMVRDIENRIKRRRQTDGGVKSQRNFFFLNKQKENTNREMEKKSNSEITETWKCGGNTKIKQTYLYFSLLH